MKSIQLININKIDILNKNVNFNKNVPTKQNLFKFSKQTTLSNNISLSRVRFLLAKWNLVWKFIFSDYQIPISFLIFKSMVSSNKELNPFYFPNINLQDIISFFKM